MNRVCLPLLVLATAAVLAGCGRNSTDLGFQDDAHMQAAFAQGYMTQKRLDASRQPAPLPDYSAVERALPAPLTPEQSAATMVMGPAKAAPTAPTEATQSLDAAPVEQVAPAATETQKPGAVHE